MFHLIPVLALLILLPKPITACCNRSLKGSAEKDEQENGQLFAPHASHSECVTLLRLDV